MPLLFTVNNRDGILAVWSLKESSQQLGSLLSLNEEDKLKFELFSSEFRKREFLTVRILLSGLLGFYPEITYNEHRKPLLVNSKINLSISHSRSLVAVVLSEFQTGVDTEETTRNVSHITGRFLCREELHWIQGTTDPNKTAVLCWSIKEAVYKMLGITHLDFRSQIQIDPVKPETSGTASVIIHTDEKSESVKVNYFYEGENVITWCVLK
jgi:4'-phosphopantetheinyl transferase